MKNTIQATYSPILVTFCFLFCLVAATFVHAQDSTASNNKWQFEITPYFLAAAMKGDVGTGGVVADIDMSFEDIWNNLDVGLMGVFEARKGPWIFAFDFVYFRLEGRETRSWRGPLGIVSVEGDVQATLTQQLYQGSVGYRVIDSRNKLDLTGGVRHTIAENELDLVLNTSGNLFPGGKRNLSGKKSWSDPVFGLRGIVPFAQKWSFYGYADFGGFGIGSDITYQVLAGIRWQITRGFSAKLAYRYLYQDYSDGGFVWDMSYQGPLLGVGFTF